MSNYFCLNVPNMALYPNYCLKILQLEFWGIMHATAVDIFTLARC